MNIREFISNYIRNRDMTLAELTTKLGYRSKTSVVRIMNGDSSIRSVEVFAEKLRALDTLSETENDQLNEAIELLRWQEDYQPSREMLGLLRGNVCEKGDVLLQCIERQSEDISLQKTPQIFEDTFAEGYDIDIMLVNSQYVPIFDKLRKLIVAQNARVSHYLTVDEDASRTIHAMNVVFPIMFMPNYDGYLLKQSRERGHHGIQSSDFMLANWKSKDGIPHESLILFDTPNHGRVYRSNHPGSLAQLLQIPVENYTPIKFSCTDSLECDDYVAFSLKCADFEQNRRVFAIKPDVCLECIPVDIILSAAREGALGAVDEFTQNEKRLVEIYAKRFRNTFERRKASHTIMKRSAMWKFARTGRLTDHFWGLRPFTLQERAAIIRHLMEQEENNPFFNIYFLKDNTFIRDMEMFCFDGKGLLIVNAETDYNLSEGHAEIMVDHPEFQRLYKEFYLKHLIKEHVISQADTLEFLRSLIEYCEDPNTGETE